MRRLCLASTLLLALWGTSPAHAWNRSGHMLSAAIAFKELSPAARIRVMAVLREHPRFGQWMNKMKQEGVPASRTP